MNWFGGNVAEAIQQAKTNRGLFIVFISGEDDVSRQMTVNWDDLVVVELMNTSHSVAIRLDPNSTIGQQFSQIYPIMCIPCVYFIGINGGVPLEVQGGLLDPSKLAAAFNKALQTSSAPSPTLETNAQTSVREGSARKPPQGISAGTADADVAVAASPEGACSNVTESAEDKLERANQLLAKRREQKAEEEKEALKKKEAERRKLGQDMNKLKEWKADVERKEVETSMKKEKEEAKLAREKVRADLERDRQERSIKYNAEKAARELEIQRKKSAIEAAAAESVAAKTAEKRESARIQFRLPDGSTVTQTFKSSDHLSEARQFIQQKLNVPNAVTLLCTYPRRTFTDVDMNSTMLDLNLAPTAALVVLLSSSSSRPPACNQGFIATILAYLFLIWAFICGIFSGPATPAVAAGREGPQQEVQNPGPSSRAATGRDSNVRQRTKPSGIKNTESNIHRLHNADDSSSDDENATWNGNSTQQM